MEEEARIYVFIHKNSSAVLTLTAVNFTDAEENLHDLVEDSESWRVDDEEGEEK